MTKPWPTSICDKAYNEQPTLEQLEEVKQFWEKAMGVGTLLHKDFTPETERIYETPYFMTTHATVLRNNY